MHRADLGVLKKSDAFFFQLVVNLLMLGRQLERDGVHVVRRNVHAVFELVTNHYVADERADYLFNTFFVDPLNCMGVCTDLFRLTAGATKTEETCSEALAVVGVYVEAHAP